MTSVQLTYYLCVTNDCNGSNHFSELLLGELFGAGVFVTTVVAGSICIAQPFKLMERPFLRDVIFYIFAGFWAFYIFYRQHTFFLSYVFEWKGLLGYELRTLNPLSLWATILYRKG